MKFKRKMISVPVARYRKLIKLEKMIDVDLYNQLSKSMEDIKQGRVIRTR